MNIKCLVLIISGLLLAAFAIVFGQFDMKDGIFFNAPFLYFSAFVCLGFGVLVWWLDVPKSSPAVAKDFMSLFYEAAKNGASGAIVFQDTDGWHKYMTDLDPQDPEEFAAVYDQTEMKCLESSIHDFLEDKERPGFILSKYLPDAYSEISFAKDEDGDIIFRMIGKELSVPEEDAESANAEPKEVDFGEDELVDDADDLLE